MRLEAKHFLLPSILMLVLALSGCASDSVTIPRPPSPEPNPTPSPAPEPIDRTLEFDLCAEANELPEGQRMYQGYEGWFFFGFDLEENFPIFEQTAFVEELGRALETQGVSLVVMPIPGRGVVRPNFVYPGDPKQRDFSPVEAETSYKTYVQTLQRAGVGIVDVMSAARAFDAAGGQTFFKRDLHWTPEGSNAIAQESAKVVRQVLNQALPTTTMQVVRTPERDREHRGKYLGDWLYKACGYLLPPEPLRGYEVVHSGRAGGVPEVILAGSSFSIAPYYDFLAVALQSEVLNVSVGAGGALVGLDTYLLDGAYSTDKPSVLVWEFPVFAPPLSEAAQRQLLGSAYGACQSTATTAKGQASNARAFVFDTAVRQSSQSHLELVFTDLSLLTFDVTLRYQNGFEETLALERTTLVPNRGRFYLTLDETVGAALESVEVHVPQPVFEEAVVQLCTT